MNVPISSPLLPPAKEFSRLLSMFQSCKARLCAENLHVLFPRVEPHNAPRRVKPADGCADKAVCKAVTHSLRQAGGEQATTVVVEEVCGTWEYLWVDQPGKSCCSVPTLMTGLLMSHEKGK